MWIIIKVDQVDNTKTTPVNEAVFETQDDLAHYVESLLTTWKNARVVVVPNEDTDHVHKKIFHLVASTEADFYAQWFDAPSS
jgi:hypothetical protein